MPAREAAALDDVGVTDTPITIGGHFPLTGVAAPGYSEIPTGAQAYFDYVNATGGVNGRKIDFLVLDDGYNPTKTSSVTNELVLQDKVFAIVGGSARRPTARSSTSSTTSRCPTCSSRPARCSGGRPGHHPYTFGWQPDYTIEGKVLGEYVAENMPDAKVGLFLQDDDFGEDGEKGVRPVPRRPDRRGAALHLGQHRRRPAGLGAAGRGRRPGARRSTPRRTPP